MLVALTLLAGGCWEKDAESNGASGGPQSSACWVDCCGNFVKTGEDFYHELRSYDERFGGPPADEVQTTIDVLERDYKRGDKRALLYLGLIYRKDWPASALKDNSRLAEKYLSENHRQRRDSESAFHLGELYLYGVSRDLVAEGIDYNKARELFLYAESLNDGYASDRLGRIYEHGLGVEVDWEMAEYYYETAAKQEVFGAKTRLGKLRERMQSGR